jgi:hypothetical protein
MDSPSEMKQTQTIFSFPSFSSPEKTPEIQSPIQSPTAHAMSAVSDELVVKPLFTTDAAGAEYRRLSGGDEGEEDGLEEFRRENLQQTQQKASPKIRSPKASFEAAPHVAALTEYLMSLPIKELNYGKAGDMADTRAKDIITKNVQDHIEALSNAIMEDSMNSAKCGASIEEDMFDDDFWLPQPEPPKRRTHSYSHPTTLETLYEDEEFDPLLPKRRSTWVSSSLQKIHCISPSFTNMFKTAPSQRYRRSPPALSQPWRLSNSRETPQKAYTDQPSPQLSLARHSISRSVGERDAKPITAKDIAEIEYLSNSPSRHSSFSDRTSTHASASSSYGSAASSYGSGSSFGSSSPQSSEFDWDSDSDDYSGCSTPEEYDPPLTSTKDLFNSFNYQLPVRKTSSVSSQNLLRSDVYEHKRYASY